MPARGHQSRDRGQKRDARPPRDRRTPTSRAPSMSPRQPAQRDGRTGEMEHRGEYTPPAKVRGSERVMDDQEMHGSPGVYTQSSQLNLGVVGTAVRSIEQNLDNAPPGGLSAAPTSGEDARSEGGRSAAESGRSATTTTSNTTFSSSTTGHPVGTTASNHTLGSDNPPPQPLPPCPLVHGAPEGAPQRKRGPGGPRPTRVMSTRPRRRRACQLASEPAAATSRPHVRACPARSYFSPAMITLVTRERARARDGRSYRPALVTCTRSGRSCSRRRQGEYPPCLLLYTCVRKLHPLYGVSRRTIPADSEIT